MTGLDGEGVADLVFQEGVHHHRGAAEIALDLVGKGLGELAFDRHTDAAHPKGVVVEVEILVEVGLIEALHKA